MFSNFRSTFFVETALIVSAYTCLIVTPRKIKQNSKTIYTAQKINFSIKDFFSKCNHMRRKLLISLHLLKKSLMKNFIFCAVL